MLFLLRFTIFAAVALFVGLGSAWRMIDDGFFANARKVGVWTIWFKEGTADADPYTVAHHARLGTLPVTGTNNLVFTAKRDEAGRTLTGNCNYEIRGTAFPALWWEIAAFDSTGRVTQEDALRSGLNASTILSAPDGSFVVRVSSEVQPGNWIATAKDQSLVMKLTILRPLNQDILLRSKDRVLPSIKRLSCL